MPDIDITGDWLLYRLPATAIGKKRHLIADVTYLRIQQQSNNLLFRLGSEVNEYMIVSYANNEFSYSSSLRGRAISVNIDGTDKHLLVGLLRHTVDSKDVIDSFVGVRSARDLRLPTQDGDPAMNFNIYLAENSSGALQISKIQGEAKRQFGISGLPPSWPTINQNASTSQAIGRFNANVGGGDYEPDGFTIPWEGRILIVGALRNTKKSRGVCGPDDPVEPFVAISTS